jgi:hypothetical protein
MNFALLGDDPVARPLLQAALADGHNVGRAALVDRRLPMIESLFGRIGNPSYLARWEDLLTDRDIEAVIVAGDSEEIQTAAKQLAMSGKPLLIVPKAEFGWACGYELSLIRDDSQVVLMPAFVHRGDVELSALSQRLAARELGKVRRLQIDVEIPLAADESRECRETPHPLPGGEQARGQAPQNSELADRDVVEESNFVPPILSSAVPDPGRADGNKSLLIDNEIEEAMLPDVDALCWLGGNYDQVTALRSGQMVEGCSQATLTLAGSNLSDATWIARRGSKRRWKLTVEAERGSVSIERSHDEQPAARQLIELFVAACRGEAVRPDWSDAVRTFDVLDAARRSVRRRRTIDLHFEALSERSQFKTQMTAIGCGLLLLTLVLMLGLLGLGSLLDARDRNVREAASLGLLLQETDFERHTAVLTTEGQSRLAGIARRLTDEPKSVFVEPTSDPPSSELDQRRRTQVVEHLNELRVVAADHRTQLAPPKNSVWETVMRILRLAWIAPLVLFLILQFLLFMARPSSSRR